MSPFTIGAAVAVRTLGNRKGTIVASDGRGRYRVEDLVGNGTMGAVVAARHLVLARTTRLPFIVA